MLIYDAYVPRVCFPLSLFFISYHALNTSSYTPLHIRSYDLIRLDDENVARGRAANKS